MGFAAVESGVAWVVVRDDGEKKCLTKSIKHKKTDSVVFILMFEKRTAKVPLSERFVHC